MYFIAFRLESRLPLVPRRRAQPRPSAAEAVGAARPSPRTRFIFDLDVTTRGNDIHVNVASSLLPEMSDGAGQAPAPA
jgi:hypothetical protein